MSVEWNIEFTNEFGQWWDTLDIAEQERVTTLVVLQREGPNARRPYVDQITTSRHHNMKELRESTTRILFVFDPRSTTILLIGGDKSGQWNKWYKKFIPIADDLYDTYLGELRREGEI